MVFKPGESGNPSGQITGKKKLAAEKFLPHIDAAVAKVLENLNDPEKSLAAAKEILDRVYGKAQQSVEHDATDNILKIIIEKVKQNAGS